MGQIAKPAAGGATRYYWYPGDRVEWIRAGLAVLTGLLAFGVTGLLGRSMLAAVTVGGSVTAVFAGINLGRRDLRAMHDFPVRALAPRSSAHQRPTTPVPTRSLRVSATADQATSEPGTTRAPEGDADPGAPALPRRAVLGPAGRAGWRALVQGGGGAVLALIIANLSDTGVVADWVLPVVPVLLGALAHQVGMVYERLTQEEPPQLPPVPAKAAAQRITAPQPPPARPAAPRATQQARPAGGPAARPANGPAAHPARPTLRLTSYRGQPPGDPRA
jgi:hypothetical protein